MKTRDPHLVFAAMANKDDNMPDCTKALWDSVNEGQKIGPYSFLRSKVTSFSTAKARNILTAIARSTDAGRLLMIDADMNAGPEQIERILSHKEPIVGGLYPYKKISLNQQWVANFLPKAVIRDDGLVPCMDVGAGFLRINLSVIDEMVEAFPESRYLSEDDPWRNEEMFDLWPEGPVTDDWRHNGTPYPRYLTEDFYFCWRARELGYPIFADTVCQCGHIGAVDYLAVAQLIEELTGKAASARELNKQGLRALLPPIVR